jgi:phospholipid N-methyltransferase
MAASDALVFLRAWAMAPLKIASVVPSSATLATMMTRDIGPDTGAVLELGPGTGPFTRALITRGVAESDLTLVEANAHFAALLRKRFPKAAVLEADAADIRRRRLIRESQFGAVVSGLPFLTIASRPTLAILQATFAALRPGGNLYQFTYGWRCPIDEILLDRLHLEAVRIGRTFRNFPPAAVFRISKVKSSRHCRHFP